VIIITPPRLGESMPLYEYKCENGHRFEEFHSIENRHNAVCFCGASVHICPSLSSFRMAGTYSVIDSDGKVCHTRQTTEKTPHPKYGYDKEV